MRYFLHTKTNELFKFSHMFGPWLTLQNLKTKATIYVPQEFLAEYEEVELQ